MLQYLLLDNYVIITVLASYKVPQFIYVSDKEFNDQVSVEHSFTPSDTNLDETLSLQQGSNPVTVMSGHPISGIIL